jgi:hypothetical protein
MRDNETWDAIPEELLMDCAQLTKANSIEGNKKDNITVIYTPWSNLKKDGSMATGQVGFKDNKKVRRVYVSQRENAIVNRLNKTKVEKHPDLRQEKEDRERELRKRERIAQQEKVNRFWQQFSHCEDATLTNISPTEEGGRQTGRGATATQVAEGPHVRRHAHRREHGHVQQPGSRRGLPV